MVGTSPRIARAAAVAAVFILLPCAGAAIDGVVINGTTGQPEPRVAVTLMSFDQGMDPVEETRSGPDGAFRLEKSLGGSGGRAVPGMLRAEFDGVSYSKMIPPGTPTSGVRLTVYSTVAGEQLPPQRHIMFFEPGSSEMVVSESFLFSNDSKPPKTFRDPDQGTLRFYLPPAAKGIVQVSASGPASMPLRSMAQKTSQENVYMVDFPIKPGENRVDLTYLVPRSEASSFEGRLMYEGLSTQLAVPAGVTVEAEGLTPLGQEPQTQALVYQLPARTTFSLAISGEGQLARGGGAGGGAGGGGAEQTRSETQVRVAPAPVAKELAWIIGITAVILGVGFYNLYTSKASSPTAAGSEGAGDTAATGAAGHAQRAKHASAPGGKPSGRRKR